MAASKRPGPAASANENPSPGRSPATIGVLFSGGLDSSILLAHLLASGERVQPIYVAGGLVWQTAELAAAEAVLAHLAGPQLGSLVRLELPLADLYGHHWSVDGRQTPDATTPDEAVYLPGRNPLLLVKSRLWCQLNGIDRLALGTLENNPFADATAEFLTNFATVLDRAMSGHVGLERPLANYSKREVLALADGLPLQLTWSCLAPLGGLHCGQCNKCHERQLAFAAGGRPDPTRYCQPAPAAAQLKTAPTGRTPGDRISGDTVPTLG